MKALLLALLLPFAAYSQQWEGVVVIEYNAGFNKSNAYYGLSRLEAARLYRMDIETKPEVKEKLKIRTVPTVVVYKDGKEFARFEGGLAMKLHATREEIQRAINEAYRTL